VYRDDFLVIAGGDYRQEWLIPWWWSGLRKNYSGSVFFGDLGLSPAGLACCRSLGFEPQQISRDDADPQSCAWFLKPRVIRIALSAGTRCAIWLDLDCQVLGDLSTIIGCIGDQPGLSMRPDEWEIRHPSGRVLPGEFPYVSGLIGMRDFNPTGWEELCLFCQRFVPGDQDVLTRLIHRRRLRVVALEPKHCLFPWSWEPAVRPAVFHHAGPTAKQLLRRELEVEDKSEMEDTL
jgi:hypothetical protein